MEQIKELLRLLVVSNTQRVGDKLEQFQPVEGDSRYEIQDKLTNALALIKGIQPADAVGELQRVQRTYQGKQAWHFKMQGSGEDRSFDEQQAESGGFFTPITLRGLPQNEQTMTLRTQCEKKLNYPGLPSQLQEEDEFKPLATLRASSIKAIQDAETDGLIRDACEKSVFALAKYLLESTACAIVRLTGRHGLKVPDQLAAAVASTKEIATQGERIVQLAEHCYGIIEEKIQSLWFTETEKKLPMTRDEFAIFQAWEYTPAVTAHYSSYYKK